MLREFAWNRHRLNALLLGCAIALPVRAQSDSPFDAPPTPALSPAELQELNSESPLATVPRTPRELFEAAVSMVDIGRTDLARKYLQQVTPGSLTDEQLAEIRETIGSPNLIRLEAIPELEPLVQPVVERSNDVLRRQAAEPQRVRNLLADLGKTPEARAAALADLKNLGPFAVPTLLASAVTEKEPARIADITTLCMSAGAPAIGPLEAALQAPEPVVQKIAAEALGRIGQSRGAVPDLEFLASGPDTDPAVRQASQVALRRLSPRPGPAGAAAPGVHLDPLVLSRRLIEASKARLQNPLADGTDPAAKLADWSWDRQKKSLVQQQVPARVIADRAALRHANRAVQLAPDDTHPVVVQRACELAALGGPEYLFPPRGESTAEPKVPPTSTAVWSQVLDLGMSLRRPEIATRAAQALAKLPETYSDLNWSDAKNPLLKALANPDPRVQFAAAETLVTRGPKHPYRGAPQVVEVLRRMLDSDATRPFAIVGEVAADRAADISGMLRELGFDTLTSVSGREAFRAASERSDVALVVLHPNLIRWTLSETVANLKNDARTAHLPIVVYGPARLAPKFLNPAPGQHRLNYATYVETADELRTQIGPVLDAAQGQTPPAGQREELRSRSIGLLKEIAQMKGTRVYDLTGLEESLAKAGTDPNLAEAAFQALASLGTRRAQGLMAESLINAPGEPVAPLVTQLLNDHIRKYGQFLPRSILRDVNVALASARPSDDSTPSPPGGVSRQPGDTFENPLEGDQTTEESSLDDIPADQAGEQ